MGGEEREEKGKERREGRIGKGGRDGKGQGREGGRDGRNRGGGEGRGARHGFRPLETSSGSVPAWNSIRAN